MITRPLTWDIKKAEEMWNAGVSISDIAAFAGVRISSVMFQAQKHGWHRRPEGLQRVYPCVVCGTPESAVRKNTRCGDCSLALKQEHNKRRRLRRAQIISHEPRRRNTGADLDVLCYRAHKERRAAQEAAQMREARLALEHELELTKPKAGRPKKFTKGFMPQTFGKFAA